MVKNKDKDSAALILEAARVVFREHGMKGARMRQIADQAGINSALLHYYFKNKEQLFKAVFKRLVPHINSIFEMDLPLFDKIRKFTHDYISFLIENPYLPSFIIQELNNNPGFADELRKTGNHPNPSGLIKQLKEEIAAKRIRAIEPFQLVSNMMSLCVFPFMAKEMIMLTTGMNKEQLTIFYASRKSSVAEFVIHSISLEGNP